MNKQLEELKAAAIAALAATPGQDAIFIAAATPAVVLALLEALETLDSMLTGSEQALEDKDLQLKATIRRESPAPAVPDEATAENVEALSGYVSTYKMTESERDIAAEVWNACRAAMLASIPSPVSEH